MIRSSGGSKAFLLIIPILILSGCSPYFHQAKPKGGHNNSNHIAEILHHEYPFEEHKNIELEDFAESLEALNQNQGFNRDNYLEAKKLAFSIPDSRIALISGKDKKLKKEETGGYIGFDIAFVPPDEYFVSKIDSSSDAWLKGLRPGYRILGWDQKLIYEAIDSFPLRWGFHPATNEYRKLLSCHYITRGQTGSSAEIFYENDQENNKGIKLKFNKAPLNDYPLVTGIINNHGNKIFDFKFINDSLGYFRIDQFTPSSLRLFKQKVVPHLDKLSGLIIDLRENGGGYDPIAVKMGGFFISQSRFYEETFIKEDTDFHIFNSLIANPEGIRMHGNVIVLTGPMTMGVGEGFARILQIEDHIRLLGSWNTSASFSLPGGLIKLANGINLLYPIGGSLDENHGILIESGEIQNGIHPDIHIPPDKESIIQMASGIDLLYYEAIQHIWR